MPPHITIDDRDDRPERMVRDPDRYFDDARRRAEAEVKHDEEWQLPSPVVPDRP